MKSWKGVPASTLGGGDIILVHGKARTIRTRTVKLFKVLVTLDGGTIERFGTSETVEVWR